MFVKHKMFPTSQILLCALLSLVGAAPMMYDQYDNYGPRMHPSMYKPYEWRESPYPTDNDYRWNYPKEDMGSRYGKPMEFLYASGPPQMANYGQMGLKYNWPQPDLPPPPPPEPEPSYPIQTEGIPIAILFKAPFNLPPLDSDYYYGRHYNDDSHSHLIQRVNKPLYQEIQEMISPYRKGNFESGREEMRVAPTGVPPMSKYLNNNKVPEQGLPLKSYSLIKDKNAHNFVVFNKLYDIGLQMNKANGYLLSAPLNHQPSQGHNQEDIEEPERDDAASGEESGSKTQQA